MTRIRWGGSPLLLRWFVVLFLGTWGNVSGQDSNQLMREFSSRLEERRTELIEVRRDLHRHPEVSGMEERTAGIVSSRLRDLGFEIRTGVGGHGVVGVLRGGRPGPIVAFRADMDAVPSTAPDPVDFRSTAPGVRHICGHDIHTTIGLALAEGFAAVGEDLQGSVMLVFQPAEENATGARAMLSDGVFSADLPQAIFALHTAPFNVGQVATARGTLMAWRDRLRVTLSGEGNLNAAARKVLEQIEAVGTLTPQQAVQSSARDAILVQARIGEQAATNDPLVVATISTANPNAKQLVENRIAKIELPGVSVRLEYQEKWVAGVTNDTALTGRAIRRAQEVAGQDSVILLDQVVPAFSEDFGSFQQQVPGGMFFLGVSNPDKGWVGMPHTPGYVADEASIFVGARVMARIIMDSFDDR